VPSTDSAVQPSIHDSIVVARPFGPQFGGIFMTQPDPLPVPPDFALEWAQDGDEQRFWMQDRMHLPNALTPLDATLARAAFSVGASAAIAKLSMPITGLRAEVYGGYAYLSPTPFMGTPEEMGARFEGMKRITGELGMTVLADWRETFEPQVLAECAEILEYDYEGHRPPG
jgi:hypothetical protein